MEGFSDRIIAFLAQPGYRPVKIRPLARSMGVEGDEYTAFRKAVRELDEQGRLVVGRGNLIRLPDRSGTITGVYHANRRGFGFVTPDEPTAAADLFIPPGDSLDALSGDHVMCRVRRRGWRGGKPDIVGEIVQVIARGHSRIVGKLHHTGTHWYVEPEGDRLQGPVHVDDVGAKAARSGDVVVLEITRYPQAGQVARGVIVERLGPHGRPGVDTIAIIRQHDIPDQFSEEALEEARATVHAFDVEAELSRREDLRDELLVTIDPVDARDFDDAVSLRRLDDQSRDREGAVSSDANRGALRRGKKARAAAVWELGVHIADVSHFVRLGGRLDAEARERGTSVYFPRHVVPMLPEVLSNGVCSLQEGQPRLCKSAFVQYDAQGRPVGARFANTVIQSAKRLTYEQASAALEGNREGEPSGEPVGASHRKLGGSLALPDGSLALPGEVVALLKEMEALARTIRQRRLRDGMLVLDLREIDLVLDDEGRVVDAVPTDVSFSHTLIEMFMVEANEAVARLLASQRVPFLRRVHDEPDLDAVENLSRFVRGLGHRIPSRPDRKDLQGLLDGVRGESTSYAVNLSVLKSLSKAEYAARDAGHYALASECYCHFTSPIRRYPDLHVHRLLEAHLTGTLERGAAKEAARGGEFGAIRQGRDRKGAGPAERRGRRSARYAAMAPMKSDGEDVGANVFKLGKHCSFAERRAETAERELRLVKVLELLSRHPGEAFDGVITGVAGFGVFVQHPRFLIEGLVEVLDLPEDRWDLDDTRSMLIGRRTGRRLRIGDMLRVTVARVDLATRRLLLALVEDEAAPARFRPRRKRGTSRRS